MQTSSLHHLCQEELAERVTSETVFLLLMVADRFSIQQLRVSGACYSSRTVGNGLVIDRSKP